MHRLFSLLLFLLPAFCLRAQTLLHHDLRGSWDTVTVLKNPDKGWYIHYYDNGLDHYGASLKPTDLLEDFPGLHHVYLRLAWSYLEPQEGKYNWAVIDSIIERWTAKDYKITFRVSCKETDPDQVFATPEWVMKAGAQGAFVGKNRNWEPDYGDPVFLEKLENFHRAFADRYDGKPYVAYVDIGSYGDWGEGHNVFGSGKDYPFEVIKKHIDIHKRCYRKSLLMISDDFITSRKTKDDSAGRILDYILANGISVRDDSVSVKYFADHYGFSTLRSGFIFDRIWRRLPVDLELDHYRNTIENNTWNEGKPFEAAMREAHATYIGFHGEPRKWLAENPDLARRMANKVGYWYFMRDLAIPKATQPGQPLTLKIRWENKGVAPAYHKYRLHLLLKSGSVAWTQPLASSDNRRWLPDSVVEETYTVTVPQNLPEGLAQVGVKLVTDAGKAVQVGFQWKTSDGFYKIGKINVMANGAKKKKKKIVLFGDSITEGAFEENGYATQLIRKHPAASGYQWVGAGIGGNRVIDLMKRVDEDVLAYKPDKVVILVGVNDCGWHTWHPTDDQVSVEQYEQVLIRLVQKIQQSGAEVILCTPALIGEKKVGGNPLDTSLNEYAAACAQVARQTRSRLVNLRQACLGYLEAHNPQNVEKGILTTDSVHLTTLGSQLVADQLSQVLP